ncbi:hypothetical protein PRZ48_008876 [Zasmidium cellare]|uniref:Uncharacterized protein n=1 Tax=Zasmidium cellare TaxID=395010 RepID=A0ABR0EGQ1_ZASCE|nr:hypothetical protein PRZ48_008876 [Zasmidium cellare]
MDRKTLIAFIERFLYPRLWYWLLWMRIWKKKNGKGKSKIVGPRVGPDRLPQDLRALYKRDNKHSRAKKTRLKIKKWSTICVYDKNDKAPPQDWRALAQTLVNMTWDPLAAQEKLLDRVYTITKASDVYVLQPGDLRATL